ncbi:SDR family NAD(P)-dependent oxidoreductase [Streptomyces sp. NPDC056653]|uniref:SDR family NAD(P)-dependent oxidoreductase n=1 Tax=Streptomyces sp. NPDC056653 TaxID=3345894 RepID=UPI0036C03131
MQDAVSRFTDRTVVVTGAGAGIGRATVLRLVAEGARVIAADISAERLDSLTRDAQGSGSVVAVPGDLTQQSVIDDVVAAGEGRVEGLANVAGIMDGWLPAAEVDDATWERVFDLNVTVPMRLTRALLPQMLERGTGALVYVSSEAGLRSSISGTAYTSAKHALNGFVKSVAFYYGRLGIRANAVAPGGVHTEIDAAFNSAYAEMVTAPAIAIATPSVTPEVIMHPILWLLSDDAPNINGVILPSDGGWTTI